jgi:hypothetical protein
VQTSNSAKTSKGHQQGRGVQPSRNAAEELLFVNLRCDRNNPAQQADNQVRLWINRLGRREPDLGARSNQQYPKEDDYRLVGA